MQSDNSHRWLETLLWVCEPNWFYNNNCLIRCDFQNMPSCYEVNNSPNLITAGYWVGNRIALNLILVNRSQVSRLSCVSDRWQCTVWLYVLQLVDRGQYMWSHAPAPNEVWGCNKLQNFRNCSNPAAMLILKALIKLSRSLERRQRGLWPLLKLIKKIKRKSLF